MIRSPARQGLGVGAAFGGDALPSCVERLDPERTRTALSLSIRQAKRNQVLDNSRFMGQAVDGTGAGHAREWPCQPCHPIQDRDGVVHSHLHQFTMLALVGNGITLPLDVEPYGFQGSGYAAGQRLLQRATDKPGRRFAQ